MQHGFNMTATDLKPYLETREKSAAGIRTWQQLFGGASSAYETELSKLSYDYSTAMAEAYKASLRQKNDIMGLGLNSGGTKEMMKANRTDLRDAYETYIKNYYSDVSERVNDYATNLQAIDTELATRADNFAQLYKEAYNYLTKELYGATNASGDVYLDAYKLDWLYKDPIDDWRSLLNSNDVAELEQVLAQTVYGKTFLDPELLKKRERSILTDAFEQRGIDTTKVIKSWDELSELLFNRDGTLNEQGTKFFDAMFNLLPEDYITANGTELRTFDKWLSDTNPELRSWWVSPDTYNYNFAGTNVGTSKIIAGLNSTDQVFAPYEYTTVDDFNKMAGGNIDGIKSAANEAAASRKDYIKDQDIIRNTDPQWGGGFSGNWFSRARQFLNTDWFDKKTREEYKERRKAQRGIAEKEAKSNTDFNNLTTQIRATDSQIKDTFKLTVGSAAYDQFMKENAGLIQRGKTLLERKDDHYSSEYVDEYLTYYKELERRMAHYVETRNLKSTNKF